MRKKYSDRQIGTYLSLSALLKDTFWKKALSKVTIPVAAFAYCTLNGMAPEDALSVIFGQRAAGMDRKVVARLVRNYQRFSQPIYHAAFLAHGMSKYWMIKTIRSIAEDTTQDTEDRLRAIELAAKLTGVATATEERRVTQVLYEGDRSLIREQIKQNIKTSFGELLNIPREMEMVPPSEEAGVPLLLIVPEEN